MDLVGTAEPARDYHGWPFGVRATPIVNVVIKYIYLLFVLLQFILALGNRPKGSERSYLASFVVFGVIQGYIIVLTTYLVILALSKPLADQFSFDSGTAFFESFFGGTKGVAGVVLIALVTIYGLNFLASFLYLDPWHMFHSYPQYMLLMSTYVNILMVYAFNNWHDVSWGTKGSDAADALPSAHILKGDSAGEAMVEEVEKEQTDIDTRFEAIVHRALAPMKDDSDQVAEAKSAEDSYKSFRTGLVVSWLISNMILIILVTSDDFVSLGVSVSQLFFRRQRAVLCQC
jgi:chitin synthase